MDAGGQVTPSSSVSLFNMENKNDKADFCFL